MSSTTESFHTVLYEHLIPDFCSRASRNMTPASFDKKSIKLSKTDMDDFVRSWNANILMSLGEGLYRGHKSGASEQFFWSGRKNKTPRTYTLSIEPIITVAALARLHLDYGWPANLIGTQSSDGWAFDAIAYLNEKDLIETIACEVKKTTNEVDTLISAMKSFAQNPDRAENGLKGASLNAFRKLQALRLRKPKIFWALGPNRYETIFKPSYYPDGTIDLVAVSADQLNFQSCKSLLIEHNPIGFVV